MHWKNVFVSFTFPLLLVLYSLWNLRGPTDGFSDIANAIGLMVAIGSAIIVGITLFFLRKRELTWWQALLISVASILVVFGLLILLTRLEQTFSAPVPYELPTGPGTKGYVGENVTVADDSNIVGDAREMQIPSKKQRNPG